KPTRHGSSRGCEDGQAAGTGKREDPPLPRTSPPPPRRPGLVSGRQEGTRRLEIEVLAADVQASRQVAAITGETTFTAVVRDLLKGHAWVGSQQHPHPRGISATPAQGDRTAMSRCSKAGGSDSRTE